MLNLIKKALLPKSTKEEVQTIIKGIHDEFDTAGEKLLAEAKLILAGNAPTDKGERLKKLGFNSSASAIQFDKINAERKEKEELATLIEYYQQWYPNNKFITEKVVKSICEKYGLLSAEVRHYKGDVPLKNIAEIEVFKLREDDMQSYNLYLQRQFLRAQINMRHRNSLSREFMGGADFEPTTEQLTERVFHAPPLNICAPEKDFDMSYLVKKGYKLELPDPIVLQPVKGGFLIVSKWGLEAEDNTLLNQKMN